MGKKKMKFPFPFKSKETAVPSSWPWPTCANPKTPSFRAHHNNNISSGDIFKTINPAYVHSSLDFSDGGGAMIHHINPYDESVSFSSPEVFADEESLESVIRGLSWSSERRLFFEPGETSSILEEAKMDGLPFKESVAMAVDSSDPFGDFRRSMEEMVEAHGLKDWECLEELLTCYLRVNGKSNHGYIVGAFVDLLVGLAFATSSAEAGAGSDAAEDHRHRQHQHPNCSSPSSITVTNSFTSPLSLSSSMTTASSTSPSFSLVEVEDDHDEIEKATTCTNTLDNASSSASSSSCDDN